MLFLEDGTKVYFKHIPPHDWQEYVHKQHPEVWLEGETGATIDMVHGLTMCTIENPDFVSNVGFAACSKSDNYVRSVGRKVSLTEALKVYCREFRAKVWERYLDVEKG